jgi:hypothetical protein
MKSLEEKSARPYIVFHTIPARVLAAQTLRSFTAPGPAHQATGLAPLSAAPSTLFRLSVATVDTLFQPPPQLYPASSPDFMIYLPLVLPLFPLILLLPRSPVLGPCLLLSLHNALYISWLTRCPPPAEDLTFLMLSRKIGRVTFSPHFPVSLCVHI